MNRKINTENNRIIWVTMNMRLRGSRLTREQISGILAGECVLEAEIADHIVVNRLGELPEFMDMLLDLQEEFSADTVKKIYNRLSEGGECGYRKSTPVLYHLGYNPVLPQEIEEELKGLFRKAGCMKGDPAEKAVFVHNEIMRIYPFKNWNEEIARAALEYILVYEGRTFCDLAVTEQEYNHAVSEYLHKGDSRKLLTIVQANLLMAEENNL